MSFDLSKIDKFYASFVGILILLSLLLIITFRSVFSAYINAYEVNPSDLITNLKINDELLDEAYDWAMKK